ncbi:FadR/GntR family transcriptional regulator [Nonomuraea pusilla]|uniref:DNA-binding transcriptional regulator, FadR family n=1 Tax=Nonomuraea pusilla TaxID=46177 RepID=A0A1H8H7K5_9ACTN|nr:FCD domain-containing protein [Nonomuraea pusilla]SEN52272.1 DNA-binding transcriptional regulator, FadR family [Nonomuraea pusilla]
MAASGSHLAVFAPVGATGRVDAVVRRLADAIALGVLADGEQLPSEAELAGLLGVSTVTLREALMALRQQGLVETRRGRGGGSFVRTPSEPLELGARLRAYAVDELRDLGDHYAAIAGAAARLAARRALPADVAPLLRSLDDMAAVSGRVAGRAAGGPSGGPSVDAGSAALIRLEGRFHVEVAAASQSARLTQEEIRSQADIGPLLWLPYGDADGHDEVTAQHRAIVEAILRGDPDQARDLAERHVCEAMERLIELRLAVD